MVFTFSNPFPSHLPPPIRPHLQASPNSATYWAPNLQVYEPMGDGLIQSSASNKVSFNLVVVKFVFLVAVFYFMFSSEVTFKPVDL